MRVNVHSHVTPRSTLGAAGAYGPDIYVDDRGYMTIRVGEQVARITSVDIEGRAGSAEERREAAAGWIDSFCDPAVRVAEMDQKGIDIMGVTCSPLFYLYDAEPEINIRFSAIQNDGLAEYCDTYPGRFFFMATLPMQDVDAAVKEARRAVGELGARAINLAGADLGGRELDDPALDPLWETACEYGVPLFIHPSLTYDKKGRWDRWAGMLGYPYQATVAFATLTTTGVLDRFPDLMVYLTHGGGFVPYQLGRIEKFGAIKRKAERPARDYLDNFLFDVLVHDLEAREFLLSVVGSERLIVGDNFHGVDSADGFAFVDELCLSPEISERIMATNAIGLFQLEGL